MLKVFAIPKYSYSHPLKRWLKERGFKVVDSYPFEAVSMISEGSVDYGIIPIASAITEKDLHICPGPMVYSEGPTLSVGIFSKRRKKLEACKSIAVTSETRTALLYLKALVAKMKAGIKLLQADGKCFSELINLGDCALVIGDEALLATSSMVYNVADIGLLVRKELGIMPVFAATATHAKGKCDYSLAVPPWPIPAFEDALQTSRQTGLEFSLSWLYHYGIIRFDYNPSALSNSIVALRDILSL
ncbi:MAG: hypothetical protein G5Z42_04470 [Caldisphaeraceae archaeon]|nr:hypothetical protein [Caldisphaeraceae archaeon]MEB3798060.1 hypothetical protein [Caldisphaeraceae archaeon]